jgi:hypothetical protein
MRDSLRGFEDSKGHFQSSQPQDTEVSLQAKSYESGVAQLTLSVRPDGK